MAKALDREIRKQLDKVVREARKIAEDGARKALTELGVEDARKPEGLSAEKAELRNRLRAHARSLGDPKQPNDSIKADRLVREIAYEHWHRALFARFLAENNLLLDPEHKVAVSLSELERIAKEEGADAMALAADWAEPMLPQIFRKDDPVLAVSLPPETKAEIAELVNGLPRAVFEADDSLGWVYQFWQADNKNRINDSRVRIGADELPAVTQLFTEDYMVLFLLENTLGAWWAGRQLTADPALAADAKSEDELRAKTSPPGYAWTYLRFARTPRDGETAAAATGPWRPAAGTFEGWPKAAKDVTVLDPCMGSGHFLVFALPILVSFRRVEESLDEPAATKSVLAENLFGLEIDPRCTQIAAFALALACWKRLGGPEVLPKLNLACSGQAVGLGKPEFLRLADKLADAEGWTGKADLLGTDRVPLGASVAATHRGELEALYDLFEQAPYLGSLIDPRRALEQKFGTLYATGMEKFSAVLERLLEAGGASAEMREVAVAAEGLAAAAALLSRRYVLIATNVPYLSRAKMGATLGSYIDQVFPEERTELAVAFLVRIFLLLTAGGSAAVVSPQNWLFLASFFKFRQTFLKNYRWNLVAKLGPAAFQDMNWWAAVTSLTIISHIKPADTDVLVAVDLGQHRKTEEKATLLVRLPVHNFAQLEQLKNPKAAIVISSVRAERRLSDIAVGTEGLSSGDSDRFFRAFWERDTIGASWEAFQRVPDKARPFDGLTDIVFWEGGAGELATSGAARVQGHAAWGRAGVLVSAINRLRAAGYMGGLYDKMGVVVTPSKADDLDLIWSICRSDDYYTRVRELSQKAHVATATLTQIPLPESASATSLYPKPYSNDPTQWLFDGHPRGSADPNVASSDNPLLVTAHGVRPGVAEHPLQVAVARLLGYRWPRQTGTSFMDCAAIIEPDEIDASGLANADGIVPLAALGGEADAASRLRELIRTVWGPDYEEGTVRALLASEDAKTNDLAAWLADEFFGGHCSLFHQSPFIWHIWDGLPGGFSAIVNYHKLCAPKGAGRRLLEKLRDVHLGEWIAKQKRAQHANEPGAEDRLIAAEHLREELTKVILGEPPYDVFVRWKPLNLQPIGWEPDIDDGVRLNIRPFLIAKPRNPRGKDACILRVTPRVKRHAGADRGAEPVRDKDKYPWFWADDADVATKDFAGGPDFKGRRYNDFHYSRSFKQAARAKAAKS